LGAIFPKALKHAYFGWMAMAFTLGLVVSTLLLTLFFFVVITPTALIARLAGKDFLSQKLDRQAKSYWLTRTAEAKQAADYERQY
jgi:hypothetical protein